MLQNFWVGTDFAKLLSELPFSNDKVTALLDTQMRNIQALEQANQHAIDAFHTVFNRQNQILHAAMVETAKAIADLPGSNPDTAATRQTEIARIATEHTLENLRQMSEAIASASELATKVLNQRMQDNIAELKEIAGTR